MSSYEIRLTEDQRRVVASACRLSHSCDEGRLEDVVPFLGSLPGASVELVPEAVEALKVAMMSVGAKRVGDDVDLEAIALRVEEAPVAVLDADDCQALKAVLEFRNRLGLGQVAIAIERYGPTSRRTEHSKADDAVSVSNAAAFVQYALGFRPGQSLGIGGTDVDTKRAYEILKVLSKASLDVSRRPAWSTVDGDGLVVRYTNDAAPEVVEIQPTSSPAYAAF